MPPAQPAVVVINNKAASPPAPAQTEDLEAQTQANPDKKKKGGGCAGCCGKCCCCCLIIIVLLILGLGLLLLILWPKPPKVTMVSIDPASSAVYDVQSDNKFDVKVNRLWGQVFYQSEPIVDFDVKDVTIKKKDTTRVEIPFTPSFNENLMKWCLKNKNFKADVDVKVELAMLKWLGKPITKKQQITIPCPKIDQSLLNNLPKDLPKGMSKDQIDKLIASQGKA